MTFELPGWGIANSNKALWSIFRCASQAELQECLARLPSAVAHDLRTRLEEGHLVDKFEIHTSGRDGGELWILLSARMDPATHMAQAVAVDITATKQYEEKINEQNALLDQTQDAILVVDRKGRVKYWNAGATSIFGWQPEEMAGRAIQDFLYDNGRKDEFQSSMEDIRQLNEWSGEQYHRRKDGKEILLDSHWKSIEGRGNGESLVMIVASDITEKRRLELQSIRSQKMESIAVLTGGLAHDLHNILAPLSMSIHVLRKRLKGKSNASLIKAIEEPIHDGVELVKNILTYGKGITGDRVKIRPKDILLPVIATMEREYGKDLTVSKRLSATRTTILGDPTQLKQVFLNLCLNAKDAMPHGGALTVEAVELEGGDEVMSKFPGADNGRYLAISVSDTGSGIPAKELDRVFEPFFTTKGNEGTGLGLSVVQGIVTSHKGYVSVESAEGEGTKFTVYLPAMPETTKR